VNVGVRRARVADARAAAEVLIRSRRAAFPAVPAGVHTDDEVREWFATVVVPGREVWVAEADDADGGEPVAVLVLQDGWVDQLYVLAEWTGRGVGSRLVALAKARHDALDLWAFQSNVDAIRFYEGHGFVEVERTDGSDNEEGEPDVHLRWERRQ